MNEFAQLASWHKATVRSDTDLVDITLQLAQVPTSPLHTRHVSPDRELAAVVAEALDDEPMLQRAARQSAATICIEACLCQARVSGVA